MTFHGRSMNVPVTTLEPLHGRSTLITVGNGMEWKGREGKGPNRSLQTLASGLWLRANSRSSSTLKLGARADQMVGVR